MSSFLNLLRSKAKFWRLLQLATSFVELLGFICTLALGGLAVVLGTILASITQ